MGCACFGSVVNDFHWLSEPFFSSVNWQSLMIAIISCKNAYESFLKLLGVK